MSEGFCGLLGRYSSLAVKHILKRDPAAAVNIRGINKSQNEWTYNERIVEIEDEDEEEEEEEEDDE